MSLEIFPFILPIANLWQLVAFVVLFVAWRMSQRTLGVWKKRCEDIDQEYSDFQQATWARYGPPEEYVMEVPLDQVPQYEVSEEK